MDEEYFDRYGKILGTFMTMTFLHGMVPISGFKDGNELYQVNGKWSGFLYNGFIYDVRGYPVLFRQNAFGGPIKPIRAIKPVRGIRQIKFIHGIRSIKPIRPIRQLSWSNCDPTEIFGK